MYEFAAERDGVPDLRRRFGSKNPKARARLTLNPSKGPPQRVKGLIIRASLASGSAACSMSLAGRGD